MKPTGAVKARQPSVLIVDDDGNFRETLKDALSLREVDVHIVDSAQEAIRKLDQVTPDLVLLDVQLPDIHGYELCKLLKRSKKLKSVPVVFISAKYTEPADREEGHMAGGQAFFSKPVNLEALWEEVNYLLDKSSRHILK